MIISELHLVVLSDLTRQILMTTGISHAAVAQRRKNYIWLKNLSEEFSRIAWTAASSPRHFPLDPLHSTGTDTAYSRRLENAGPAAELSADRGFSPFVE